MNVAHELKPEEFDKNGHATGYCSNIFERYEERPLDHSDYDFSNMSYRICNVVRTFLSEKGEQNRRMHWSWYLRSSIKCL